MNNISGSIVLEAIMDGVTIVSSLQTAGNYPFIQRYKKATGEIIPDFSTISNNDTKPALYPHIVRSDNSTPLTVQSATFKYNGVVCATYNYVDSSSVPVIVSQFQSIFAGVMIHPDYYPSGVKVPAIRIIGNLVGFGGNEDNDKFECAGTVKVSSDQTLSFNNLFKEFVIEEANANQYTLWITSDNSGQFIENVSEITLTAHVDVDGNLSQGTLNTSLYNIQWSKIVGKTETSIDSSTTNYTLSSDKTTLTVKADGVDGQCTFRAKLVSTSNTTKVLAADMIQLTDFTDPLEMQWRVTGDVAGYQVKSGGTALISVSVVRRSDGATQSGWHTLLVCRDTRDGKILSSPVPVKDGSLQITYDQIVAKGRKIGIYASASPLLTTVNTKYDKFMGAITNGTFLMPEELQQVSPSTL